MNAFVWMSSIRPVLWLALPVLACSAHSETLEAFAQKCDAAIGISVPSFTCDAGTQVPDTHPTSSVPLQGSCDRPDQLNQDCDPGSRFQVLVNTPNAYVVGHCRKRGENLTNGRYGDIAVIQHNRINGATCFYQGALNLDHSGNVKAPSSGVGNPAFWMTPTAIAQSGFPCAHCHDNGAIIRSPYLSQIGGIDTLPGAGDSGFNRNQPYSFVGSDFLSWKTYKVEIAGNLCNGCHRLGVSNLGGGGTSRDFGVRATATSQTHKNPHSAASPLWMLPGQTSFNQGHADFAVAIKQCADQFQANGSLPNTSSCRISQFSGNATSRTCQFGADQCKQGFVWREAFPGDHVCVSGASRSQAWADNAAASQRRAPNGGPFGPDTCKQGFVWREAAKRPADHVCVLPPIRATVAAENGMALSRNDPACKDSL